MFSPIAAVPAAPPTSGLVAAAARPTVDRWEDGLSWVPERCGTAYQLVPWCGEPVGGYTPPRPSSAYYRPVPARIADECSTMGGRPDLDRARRVAEAQFPYIVARELWTGVGTIADPYLVGAVETTNLRLASTHAQVIGSGGSAALVGLGKLEAAAMDATHGQPVFIHAPVSLAWTVAPSLFQDGNQFLTAAGSTVVFDAGYPGTGPAGQAAGATVWCYATSPVAVLASPWDLLTDDAQVVDRAKNTRTTWASRVFAALFDPCVHLATEITL